MAKKVVKAVKKAVKKTVKKKEVKVVVHTCTECAGKGLKDSYTLCPTCSGNGTTI